MSISRLVRWLALACTVALAAPGCTSDCDRVRGWRNANSDACRACNRDRCAAANQALLGAAFTSECGGEYQCANGCFRGDRNDLSTLDCACVDNCIRTPNCQRTFDNWLRCAVEECEPSCR